MKIRLILHTFVYYMIYRFFELNHFNLREFFFNELPNCLHNLFKWFQTISHVFLICEKLYEVLIYIKLTSKFDILIYRIKYKVNLVC